MSAHSAAVDAALAAFSREAVGSPELRQPFETKLKAELAKQFKASHLTSVQQASSCYAPCSQHAQLGLSCACLVEGIFMFNKE